MKTVLVIGGSSGIGGACVDVFTKNKWSVLATFLTHEKKTIKNTSVVWSFLDITDTQLSGVFVKKLPKLDSVIICAAKNITESLESVEKNTDLIFDTNIISQIKIISLLKKKLKKGSSVILFSSITGRIGSRRRVAYSASKSAIFGLVKSLAADLAPNTRVNAVCPGYINTIQYTKNSTISNQERTKSILLNRLGTPEEVARLVFFLSSEEASYVNAQSINIDGGVF